MAISLQMLKRASPAGSESLPKILSGKLLYYIRMLIQLLINALAFYITAYIMPGITISGWVSLFVIAIVWGILTVVIKPILIVLTLPITILTLGLFTIVINAVLLLITSNIVPGFSIDGFGTAVLAVIVLSIVNSFLGAVLAPKS